MRFNHSKLIFALCQKNPVAIQPLPDFSSLINISIFTGVSEYQIFFNTLSTDIGDGDLFFPAHVNLLVYD
jgi:hypothetical protein